MLASFRLACFAYSLVGVAALSILPATPTGASLKQLVEGSSFPEAWNSAVDGLGQRYTAGAGDRAKDGLEARIATVRLLDSQRAVLQDCLHLAVMRCFHEDGALEDTNPNPPPACQPTACPSAL